MALLTLTACATPLAKISTRSYPEPPSDLATCFGQKVKVPGKKGTPLTAKQTQAYITKLWAMDANKSKCGRRLLAFLTNVKVKA